MTLRTNPCICHARPGWFDAVLEFRRGECARCGRFLPWALAEVWEDGLGLRALSLAVDESALSLREAAIDDDVENGDLVAYARWLMSGAAERVDVIKLTKARMTKSMMVAA